MSDTYTEAVCCVCGFTILNHMVTEDEANEMKFMHRYCRTFREELQDAIEELREGTAMSRFADEAVQKNPRVSNEKIQPVVIQATEKIDYGVEAYIDTLDAMYYNHDLKKEKLTAEYSLMVMTQPEEYRRILADIRARFKKSHTVESEKHSLEETPWP